MKATFPKGTNFVINHASIFSDAGEYSRPQEFQPERWLNGHETDIVGGSWQFGYGRRVCVGHRLAQKSLFINLARLIYCFDSEAVGFADLFACKRRSKLNEVYRELRLMTK